MTKLFGTDGIRGLANTELGCELAIAVGRATAYTLSKKNEGKKVRILIGKDTRISSDMLESALAAGISSVGADVFLLGCIPTPAVAYLIKYHGADAGIVISASHNPVEYNGIKVFDSSGFKLSVDEEYEIEKHVNNGEMESYIKSHTDVGCIKTLSSAEDDYVNYLTSCIPAPLDGIKVVVDCANGAAYNTSKRIFDKLKANVIYIANNPDGLNINKNVGSTHLDNLKETVKKEGADIGIAFDGDADRCLAVDENGEEIDGDKIIGIFAKYLKEKGKLNKDTVVITIYTNLGFIDYCKNNGIKPVRTAVGDRYVLEEMLRGNYSLGGEQSGHIILKDCSTTGDGQLTALMLLMILKQSGLKASEMTSDIQKYPQVMINIPADAEQKIKFNSDDLIQAFINEKESDLFDSGRVVSRVSGTEPLIRIMVEGKDKETIKSVAEEIRDKVLERI